MNKLHRFSYTKNMSNFDMIITFISILSIPNFDDIGSLSVENWNDTPKCKYYLLPFISEGLFHFQNKAWIFLKGALFEKSSSKYEVYYV